MPSIRIGRGHGSGLSPRCLNFLLPGFARRVASLRSIRPSRGERDKKPRSLRSIRRCWRTAWRIRRGVASFDRAARCLPNGMPLMMTAFLPLEFVVTPDTTYVLTTDYMYFRRIFTDGRDWPRNIQQTFAGYSIGRWIDEERNGIYNVLEVETRGFTGPRVFDATGLPLHSDNQSIFKERIYRERGDANVLHDEITVIDHALTRPWTVDKKYLHNPNPHPNWIIGSCVESNMLVPVGRDAYAISADGRLMPITKDQPPPDLRYFKQGVKQPQH